MCIDTGGHKGARPDQILLTAATWLVAAPCGGCILAADPSGRAEFSCPRVMLLKFGSSCGGGRKGAGLLLRLIKISTKHTGFLERMWKVNPGPTVCPGFM